MKRSLIAPFRLDPVLNGTDPADLLGLCRTVGFASFIDLLEEGVIVLDAEDRIVELNKAAEASTGIQRAIARGILVETVSAKSRIDLRPLLAIPAVGQRSLSLRSRHDHGEIRATLHAWPGEGGRPAARLVLLHPPGAGTPISRAKPATGLRSAAPADGLPLYQSRLEPLIELGVRAFRARRRILLLGETGVGKTTLVMQMHRQVAGPDRPYVHVNCSSISETLFEAEMFGYERGAFTGALASGKPGFIEAANGGTLFLDEIGDMPRSQQAKLLKFLEDGCIQPVGGVRQKAIDVYVVCATNHDLAVEVGKGLFREDLYYRIAMIPLMVPPLREHREDLPGLIDTLVANLNLTRKPKLRLSGECRRLMIAHAYPGNMRELLGVIARLDLLADEVADAAHLPPAMLPGRPAPTGSPGPGNRPLPTAGEAEPPPVSGHDPFPGADSGSGHDAVDQSLKSRVKAYERQIIEAALKSSSSKRQAARALGIDISSLIRKLQE
jgi:transcriptional regulator with PAS, ATPase and Fis domain